MEDHKALNMQLNTLYRIKNSNIYFIRLKKTELIKKKEKATDRTIYELKEGALQ